LEGHKPVGKGWGTEKKIKTGHLGFGVLKRWGGKRNDWVMQKKRETKGRDKD